MNRLITYVTKIKYSPPTQKTKKFKQKLYRTTQFPKKKNQNLKLTSLLRVVGPDVKKISCAARRWSVSEYTKDQKLKKKVSPYQSPLVPEKKNQNLKLTSLLRVVGADVHKNFLRIKMAASLGIPEKPNFRSLVVLVVSDADVVGPGLEDRVLGRSLETVRRVEGWRMESGGRRAEGGGRRVEGEGRRAESGEWRA
jgi:hypothetical protein